jgi:hypothetical protein
VSYSSASITKYFESVNRKELPKFSAMPPIRKLGLSPAFSRTQASSEVVVVFPCVPATASECRPRMNSSFITAAADVYLSFSTSTASSSGFPRDTTFPTTTTSGLGERFSGRYP